MLIVIDIGNTLTKFGLFDNDLLIGRFAASTLSDPSARRIFSQIPNRDISAVVVSCVVPKLRETYAQIFKKTHGIEPIFIDSSFDFDLKINYFPPENLGIDRLVAAFAAVEKWSETCIVCDFGTATTIDVVTANREFSGGIIAPGMKTMSESLFAKTSKLPRVEIEKPPRVIGDSTTRAIQSGIYFGYIGLVDGIVERMTNELGGEAKVVATGGFAALIAESSAKIDIVDDNLLFDGLRLIYEKRIR